MKIILGLLIGLVLWTSNPAMAADANDVGMVKSLSGLAEIKRGTQSLKAEIGMLLKLSDVVQTGANSTVGISMRDNAILSAGPNSVLRLDKFVFDSKTQKGEMEATLQRGSLAGISGAIAKNSPEAVRFKTSTLTLGVRGTEFIIEAAERGE